MINAYSHAKQLRSIDSPLHQTIRYCTIKRRSCILHIGVLIIVFSLHRIRYLRVLTHPLYSWLGGASLKHFVTLSRAAVRKKDGWTIGWCTGAGGVSEERVTCDSVGAEQ